MGMTLIQEGGCMIKRRLFIILTALALCLACCPRAFAAETYSDISNNSPASGSGYEWDEASKTLTLTDFHQETPQSFDIVLPADSTLVLEGENTITLGNNPQAGVSCWDSLAQCGAAYARGSTSTLTFDGYICQDLRCKSVQNTAQSTVFQCLADKDGNILSSVAPAARVNKPDGSSLYV